MDFLSPLYNNITISTLACTFVLLFFICKILLAKYKSNGDKKKLAPELSGGLPIIGHLHLLMGSKKPIHMILASIADNHGPIFRMRLGANQSVVVSNSRIAKECFTTNDKALATRPKALCSEIIGYNYALFGIAPYGAYWREIRKIVVLELLSNRRIELLRHKRESYIKKSIKATFDHWSKHKDAVTGFVRIEMMQWFGTLILNLTVSMLFGVQEVEEESQLQKSIRTLFRLFGSSISLYYLLLLLTKLFGEPVVADFIPWLRWLDIGGHEKAMRQTAMEIDSFTERWLEEHRRKRNSKAKEDEDFMDTMLSLFDDNASNHTLPPGVDTNAVIKSTCLTMLLAGADTSTVTLTWALSLLLNNYNVLEKIQDELDTHVGKQRRADESDLKHLIYLQAVVKETLRLYPAAPLSVPHEAMEDCTIDGYHIPKGTRIVSNISKIHRDPTVWDKPDEFRPERFLTSHKDVDVRGNHFELIPFGSGRRMCPGLSLGLQVVQLALASLIQGFDLRRLSDEPIDLLESCGVTNLKATPLQALLVPRLPSNLYG